MTKGNGITKKTVPTVDGFGIRFEQKHHDTLEINNHDLTKSERVYGQSKRVSEGSDAGKGA